jgi:putative peptidoglycan lipid II flippase
MSKIVKSSLQISLWTTISKLFGLLRDLCLASVFGVGNSADVVNVMLRMPNFFRRIFAEGALSNVFIPIFNQKTQISSRDAVSFANQLLIYLLCIVFLIVLVIEIWMPYVVGIVAPGFLSDSAKMKHAIFLCRVSMPCLFSITAVGLFGSILNSKSKFFAFSISPVIMSCCVIIAAKIGDCDFYHRAFYLAVGLLFSGLLQIVFMIVILKKNNIAVPGLPTQNSHNQIIIFLKQLFPAGLSASIIQLQLLISQSIASFFPGSISILAYSERLYQVPLSILGIAFSSAILPELATMRFRDDKKSLLEMHNKAVKVMWILSIPASVIIMILALPIVSLVYERGSFTHDISYKVAITVTLFTLGSPAIILSKLFNNLFYVYQDTSSLFKITLVALISNVVFNLLFVKFFGYLGIAVGSSVASWLQLALLIIYSFRKGYFYPSRSLFRWMAEVLSVGFIMGCVMHFVYLKVHDFFGTSGFFTQFLLLLLLSFVGIMTYLLGIVLTKKLVILQNKKIAIR